LNPKKVGFFGNGGCKSERKRKSQRPREENTRMFGTGEFGEAKKSVVRRDQKVKKNKKRKKRQVQKDGLERKRGLVGREITATWGLGYGKRKNRGE